MVVVPGLGVRSYAIAAVDRARRDGHRVSLLRAPSWRGTPTDLAEYGHRLAADLERRDEQVDLLVGLSVGTQAAAAAAARTGLVRRLLLVSPTVDPALRTLPKLLKAWWAGNEGHGEPGFFEQVPDWAQAGVLRLATGFVRTLRVPPLEAVLPRVAASVTVMHTEYDDLGSEQWAKRLVARADGRFLFRPHAPHSWPVGDEDGFAEVIRDLLTNTGTVR